MSPQQRYTAGWIIGAAGYAMPLVVGSLLFLDRVPPMLTGDTHYLALIHIGLVNLVFTGVSGIVCCCYGLRLRIRAFWYLHLVFVLWVTTNDLYGALRVGFYPTPIVPMVLGTLALVLTFDCLRDTAPHSRGDRIP